jgi:hypothetical protein
VSIILTSTFNPNNEHYTLFLFFAPFIAMSGSKAKSATNGTKKSKGSTTQDNSAPAASAPVPVPVPAPIPSSGKPDRAAYDAEQQRIKNEVDLLQEKLVRGVSRLCLL